LKILLRIIENETFSAYLLLPISLLSIVLGSHFGSNFFEQSRSVLGWKFSITEITLNFLLGFFFYNIGLELRFELAEGALQDKKILAISAIAAALGMLVPALTFIIYNRVNGTPTNGWGITMATDLPLVLALIAILKKSELKGFILALATIDDVGSIIVLTLVYKEHLHMLYILALVALLILYFLYSYLFTSRIVLIVIFIVGLVIGHKTGIQTSLVSVLFGIFTFSKERKGIHLHQKLMGIMEPFSAFVVVPIFVFVSLFRHFDFSIKSIGGTMVLSLVITRLIGKPIGIFSGILLAKILLRVKLPFSKLDALLIGALGTLGLSVSLIFAQIDFQGSAKNLAIMAILLTIPAGIVLSFLIRSLSRGVKTL